LHIASARLPLWGHLRRFWHVRIKIVIRDMDEDQRTVGRNWRIKPE
jgi:hypothetical protein